jgi:TPR repeat protein
VGLPASDEEAFRWFSRAAEQGHSHAMLILGGLYAIGRGTAKDNVKAYKWAYVVASASRVEEFRNGARQLMGVLEARMAPEEINLAKADATSWRAAPGAGEARPHISAVRLNPAPQATTGLSPAASSTSPSPAPLALAPQAQPSLTLLPSPAPKTVKSEDIDSLLDQVPQGLRKRFGF